MRVVGLTGGIASGKSTVSNFFKSEGIPVVDADIIAREIEVPNLHWLLNHHISKSSVLMLYHGLTKLKDENSILLSSLFLIFLKQRVNIDALIVMEYICNYLTFLQNVLRKGTGGWKKVVAAFGDCILLESGEVDRALLGQIVFADPEKRQLLNRLLAPYISSGILWEVVKLWFKGSQVIILDIPLLFEAKLDRFTKPIIVIWVDPDTQLQRLMARDRIPEEQAKNRINAQMPLHLKRAKADIVVDNSGSMDETRAQLEQVLNEVTSPLKWKEFIISRNGVVSVIVSAVVCVFAVQKHFSR